MKNTYFKLVTTEITKEMYNDVLLNESIIRNEMMDKRGLLRGHIEDIEFNTQEREGAPIIPVKMAGFVCARTGYILTLDYIQGFEASQNSPQVKANINKEKQMKESKLTKSQFIVKTFENFRVDGGAGSLIVKIRFDDRCGNGHNTFSITGDLRRDDKSWCSGAIHSDIEEFAPEIAHLIKWHGMTSESPLHYISNTTYLASDKDCWGLSKGEKKQILRGGDKTKPCWELAYVNGDVESKIKIDGLPSNPSCLDSELPETNLEFIKYVPWCRIGEGKEPQLDAARRTAIWEDATLEQLQDKEALQARLPALIEEFASVIESLGMEF
ncbi:hypothetical protein NVP1072O_47 [Vibrio phage 1.072.O._10N.286.48.A12]|nr:hypothetical protein NVP1004O_46 [Vibrio phage 1.004.O._10N.261.54.A2]AUR83606.1 hypothetical protein NVP1037O_46 [Vibrio phage 1.037.O._10N.261.52.F7]AUR84491.1 hypothetical protein NVP1056O_49 [Vibrio phage 1.056.O._10N.261.48.C11]AUR85008.1 hypothetical protein NVP1066O_49 [Vibrio phage 1.066.O._10N.286.46.E8]AUR85139.1 hypothetical protein NVP1068O_49 [Vibrio phage 1.068.O._10N.261.51.F8]AUR85364.1 hypothetical protein NVP1072O_47 [Vibrio phage 1.072.O._10N.286.48.A12]